MYNTRSGDTHLLESPGFEILQLLTMSPQTAASLTSELKDLFLADEPAQVASYIGTTLLRLQDAGLISDVPH